MKTLVTVSVKKNVAKFFTYFALLRRASKFPGVLTNAKQFQVKDGDTPNLTYKFQNYNFTSGGKLYGGHNM